MGQLVARRVGVAEGRPAMPERGRGQGFSGPEQAWFWAMAALAARHDGQREGGSARVPRPCEPDDVIKCLDGLYRHHRIDLAHARVLRIWGERGVAPDPRYHAERADAVLWREAMERLSWPLRMKGIVAG